MSNARPPHPGGAPSAARPDDARQEDATKARIEDVLRDLVAKGKAESDPEAIRSLLKDLIPKGGRHATSAVRVAEQGLPRVLASASPLEKSLAFDQTVRLLVDDTMAPDLARWAVSAWYRAFGIEPPAAPPPPATPVAAPGAAAAPVPSPAAATPPATQAPPPATAPSPAAPQPLALARRDARRSFVGALALQAVVVGALDLLLSVLDPALGLPFGPAVPIVLSILTLFQAFFLSVPYRVEAKPSIRRSALWLPILSAGFVAGVAAFMFLGSAVTLVSANLSMAFGLTLLGSPLAVWIAWPIVFWRQSARAGILDVLQSQNTVFLVAGGLGTVLSLSTALVLLHKQGSALADERFCVVSVWVGFGMVLFALGPIFFAHDFERRQAQ